MLMMKKLLTLINTKIHKSSKKNTLKNNISVFTSTDLKIIPNTCDSVFKAKNIFLDIENDKIISENHRNDMKNYNTFLKYVHDRQGKGGILPPRDKTEIDLSISRKDRLNFVDKALKDGFVIKKANNKIYWNKNKDLEDSNND